MRELFLRLTHLIFFFLVMSPYAALLWLVESGADFVARRADSLELAVELAAAERRTRNERKLK